LIDHSLDSCGRHNLLRLWPDCQRENQDSLLLLKGAWHILRPSWLNCWQMEVYDKLPVVHHPMHLLRLSLQPIVFSYRELAHAF
jgi:hypothetical protein